MTPPNPTNPTTRPTASSSSRRRQAPWLHRAAFLLPACLTFLDPAVCLAQPPKTSPANRTTPAVAAAALPQLLGPEYVDIRTGFSLRPLAGSELADVEAGPAAEPNIPPFRLADWELLRQPESLELVRFTAPQPSCQLTVFLLVTRNRLSLDELAAARAQLWAKHPQASQIDSTCEPQASPPLARLSLLWQPRPSDHTLPLQEALVQADKNRFFLLTLQPNGLAAASPNDLDRLMTLLLADFKCLDAQQQNIRQRDARKKAEQFLAGLQFATVKRALQPEAWFRVLYAGKDVGFYRIQTASTGPAEKPVLALHFHAYVNERAAGEQLARLLGWARATADDLPDAPVRTRTPGPVRLEGTFELDGALKSERFRCRTTLPDADPPALLEQGLWQAGRLTVKHLTPPADPNAFPGETLEVNDRLYLPGALAPLLPRLLELKPADEYLFLIYNNRTLRYYSLRVVGRRNLLVTLTSETPSAAPPATATTPSPSSTREIPTTYLVAQFSPEGPIVETWIDADQPKASLVRLHANNGLTLLASSESTIKQLWPEPLAKPFQPLSPGPTAQPDPDSLWGKTP